MKQSRRLLTKTLWAFNFWNLGNGIKNPGCESKVFIAQKGRSRVVKCFVTIFVLGSTSLYMHKLSLLLCMDWIKESGTFAYQNQNHNLVVLVYFFYCKQLNELLGNFFFFCFYFLNLMVVHFENILNPPLWTGNIKLIHGFGASCLERNSSSIAETLV